MILVGLLFPESFGRAYRIEHLYRPVDLEASFGAAGSLVTHVGNPSFRVATACTGCTAYNRGSDYFFLVSARNANTSSSSARRLSEGRSFGWMVCLTL